MPGRPFQKGGDARRWTHGRPRSQPDAVRVLAKRDSTFYVEALRKLIEDPETSDEVKLAAIKEGMARADGLIAVRPSEEVAAPDGDQTTLAEVEQMFGQEPEDPKPGDTEAA